MSDAIVDSRFRGKITLHERLRCNCPHADMEDTYDVKIVYRPTGSVLELENLTEWLDSFSEKEMTQEDVTEEIFDRAREAAERVYVRVEGKHFGIDVVTERGEEP